MSTLGMIGGTPAAMGAAPAPPAGATSPPVSPYTIAGNLPFGSGGNAFGQAIGGPLGSAYMSAYNSALQQNQAMYQNILGGYQQTAGNLANATQSVQGGYGTLGQNVQGLQTNALNWQTGGGQNIEGGYNQLQQNVLGGIQNITAAQQQAIANAYQQQSGQLSQNMINAGLGNTTVQGSMQGGLLQQEQLPLTALANQQAQLTAGYQSQLGLSGLGYENQLNQQNVALINQMAGSQQQIGLQGLQYGGQAAALNANQANQQLNWMNTVNMAYPNAQSYGQLSQAQAALAAQQAAAAQAQQNYYRGFGASLAGGRGGGSPIAAAPGQGNIPFAADMGGGYSGNPYGSMLGAGATPIQQGGYGAAYDASQAALGGGGASGYGGLAAAGAAGGGIGDYFGGDLGLNEGD